MAFVVIKMPIGGTRVDFIGDLLTRDDKLRFETVMIIVEVVKSCLAATGPAHGHHFHISMAEKAILIFADF